MAKTELRKAIHNYEKGIAKKARKDIVINIVRVGYSMFMRKSESVHDL